MDADGLVAATLNYAMTEVEHVMEPSKQRLLSAFFSMMNYSVKQLIDYENNHRDFPLAVSFLTWWLVLVQFVNSLFNIFSLAGSSRKLYWQKHAVESGLVDERRWKVEVSKIVKRLYSQYNCNCLTI